MQAGSIFACLFSSIALYICVMIQHVFFDLDHTLWDFETNATQSLHDLYNQLQLQQQGVHSLPIFLEKYMHHNTIMWQKYHNGLITSSDLKWKRMAATLLEFKIGNETLAKQMAENFLSILPEKKGVIEYTFEILNYLQNKNYQLHLITNGFEVVQHRKLAASGLDKYFNHVITSEATGFIKPHKEIFDHALHVTNATVNNSIMIGDNIEADIIGAHNAGWKTIFANHINTTSPKEATYTIKHLKELENLL
jgi:putative hydrolase of the HAD superfamily